MDRRSCLKTVAALTAGGALSSAAPAKPVRLYVDLYVAPDREEEMVANYHVHFEPVIRRQPGFAGVRLMKLRRVLAGNRGVQAAYRLMICFETEEQRLAWVATPDHRRLWPAIEQTLTGEKYTAILYDEV